MSTARASAACLVAACAVVATALAFAGREQPTARELRIALVDGEKPLARAQIIGTPTVWLDKDVGRDTGGTAWLVHTMRLVGARTFGSRATTDEQGRARLDVSALDHPSGAYGTSLDLHIDVEGTFVVRRVAAVDEELVVDLALGHVVRLALARAWPHEDLALAVVATSGDGNRTTTFVVPSRGATQLVLPTGVVREHCVRVELVPQVCGARAAWLVLENERLTDGAVPAPALPGYERIGVAVRDAAPRRPVWTNESDRGYPATLAVACAAAESEPLFVRPGFVFGLFVPTGVDVAIEPAGQLAVVVGDVELVWHEGPRGRRVVIDLSAPTLVVSGRLLNAAPRAEVTVKLAVDGGELAASGRSDAEGNFQVVLAATERLAGFTSVDLSVSSSPDGGFTRPFEGVVPTRLAARRQAVQLGDVELRAH